MGMQNSTLITLAWELYEQGIPKSRIAGKLGRHRETIHLWIKGIQMQGLMPFLDDYEQAKKGERRGRQVDPLLKRWVWDIREREWQCCGQKIQYFLEKERRIHLSVPKIYEILAEKYAIRTRWRKNQVRGPLPQASGPREVVQMDSVDFGGLFAFTAVDIFTREADVLLAPELTARHGLRFLRQSMARRFDEHVHLLQTDGGPEFKADFLADISAYCDRHRVARPYRKNEQSFIESFNRTLRKECLGWNTYRLDQLPECSKLVEAFLTRYHYHRPHLGLAGC
jgi:transposase InsO family protein